MRILVFIESDQYIRNYVRTSVFEGIAGHEVRYVLAESVKLRDEVEKKGLLAGVVRTNKVSRLIFRISSALQMYDRGKINKNFLFRLRHEYAVLLLYRKYGIPFGRLSAASPLRQRISGLFGNLNPLARVLIWAAGIGKTLYTYARALPGLIKYFLIIVLSKLRLKSLIHFLFIHYSPINSGIKDCLLRVSPDLVIIPSSIIESFTYEFIRTTKKLNLSKTLVLIDNWDNLSSKSAFIQNPDFLTVWGQQGLQFAKEFHQILPHQVHVIGSPRFDVYWDYLSGKAREGQVKQAKVVDHPYILFAGCAAGFDEIGALKSVNDFLDLNTGKFPAGTKVLYRPHPWGGGLDVYEEKLRQLDLTHIVVDPQVRHREASEAGSAFQPDLNYYPALLDHALFVICPLSTMMLEATIMRKPVLALVHDDGISVLTPKRMLDNYVHFNGVERLKNITFIKDLGQLGPAMLKALDDAVEFNEAELEYFVASSKKTRYQERLVQCIDRIGAVVPVS